MRVQIDWESVKAAVDMVQSGGAKQIKNEHWTVYQTESCTRIDIHHIKGEKSAGHQRKLG